MGKPLVVIFVAAGLAGCSCAPVVAAREESVLQQSALQNETVHAMADKPVFTNDVVIHNGYVKHPWDGKHVRYPQTVRLKRLRQSSGEGHDEFKDDGKGLELLADATSSRNRKMFMAHWRPKTMIHDYWEFEWQFAQTDCVTQGPQENSEHGYRSCTVSTCKIGLPDTADFYCDLSSEDGFSVDSSESFESKKPIKITLGGDSKKEAKKITLDFHGGTRCRKEASCKEEDVKPGAWLPS